MTKESKNSKKQIGYPKASFQVIWRVKQKQKRTVGDLLSQGISSCFLFFMFFFPSLVILVPLVFEAHLHLRFFLYVGINFKIVSKDTGILGKLC
jgi:phosphate starvation-inducible membrane PsiE